MKDICVDETLIEYKSEVKYLGITLDKKLLWNRHVALTTNKKITQVTTRNTFDKLQRLACVCITGAMRTCLTKALKVILDLTPLHIVVEVVVYAEIYRVTRVGAEGNEIAFQRT
ncbi:hypothetical protein Trydic_g15752 [Trypoxylus dichotomus]